MWGIHAGSVEAMAKHPDLDPTDPESVDEVPRPSASKGRTDASNRGSDSGVAFFDLDRTLLTGASGPYISEALRHVGLLAGEASPIESLVFKIFNTIGETRPAMLVSRQGARMAKGWDLDLVRKAADMAAESLAECVAPYALPLLEEHREAGRRLVIATTTPEDLVRPLAEALGFDDVIATRYGVVDGHYDGTIDGLFVWGKDKARAVAEWAVRHDVDLDASYGYSDSFYDVPLLSIVGHPTAVNPDPRMLGMATLRRWPVVHLDVPSGVPKFLGMEPQDAVQLMVRPQLFPYVRFQLSGLERLPMHGKAILVANHRSYFDPLAIGYLLSQRGRPVRFLGKKEVFDAPVIGDFAAAMGGIRVDRGTGSDEPLHAAEEALNAGEMVAVMPQGTIPRGPAFFDPELKGRWGAVKLAHATGAPVIPVGIWGTEKVWPRSSKLPNVTNVFSPPTVWINVGEAVRIDGDDVEKDTATMMSAIVDLLPDVARVQRDPTPEELAATYPDGKVPDDVEDAAVHEGDRRPGTD
jgi:putative phosphoserine phosphatase/1-acylglycerol-3-phosphate O-acyltransferase